MKNSIDDIVFEGRNKDYGAYFLRKMYHRNMTLGIGSSIFLFALLFILPVLIRLLNGSLPETHPTLEVKEVILQKTPPLDPHKDVHHLPKRTNNTQVDKFKIVKPEVKKDVEV